MTTDGENTDGPGLGEVSALVDERIANISAKVGKATLLFTYSVSEESQVHEYPKHLACSVEFGLWSKITYDDDIVDSLSTYYRLFALGLGSDNNNEFAAWVEPYEFKTGNALGTTVSVPVYDRSTSPHLFLGVVGIDVALDALDSALATDGNSATSQELRSESIRRVVQSSDASCPLELGLSPCELEAYRSLSAPGNEAICGINCTGLEVSQVQEEPCPTVSDYPLSLFGSQQRTSTGITYEEVTCCSLGGNSSTEGSNDICFSGFPTSNTDNDTIPKPISALIVGAVVGGVVVLGVLVIVLYGSRRPVPETHHPSAITFPHLPIPPSVLRSASVPQEDTPVAEATPLSDVRADPAVGVGSQALPIRVEDCGGESRKT